MADCNDSCMSCIDNGVDMVRKILKTAWEWKLCTRKTIKGFVSLRH